MLKISKKLPLLSTIALSAILISTSPISYARAQEKAISSLVSPKGNWSVQKMAANTDNGYCALSRSYDNGQVLTLGQNVMKEYSLAIDYQTATLNMNKPYKVTLQPAPGQIRAFEMMAASQRAMVIRLGFDDSFMKAIEKSGVLKVQIDGKNSEFKISEFGDATSKLSTCMSNLTGTPVTKVASDFSAEKVDKKVEAVKAEVKKSVVPPPIIEMPIEEAVSLNPEIEIAKVGSVSTPIVPTLDKEIEQNVETRAKTTQENRLSEEKRAEQQKLVLEKFEQEKIAKAKALADKAKLDAMVQAETDAVKLAEEKARNKAAEQKITEAKIQAEAEKKLAIEAQKQEQLRLAEIANEKAAADKKKALQVQSDKQRIAAQNIADAKAKLAQQALKKKESLQANAIKQKTEAERLERQQQRLQRAEEVSKVSSRNEKTISAIVRPPNAPAEEFLSKGVSTEPEIKKSPREKISSNKPDMIKRAKDDNARLLAELAEFEKQNSMAGFEEIGVNKSQGSKAKKEAQRQAILRAQDSEIKKLEERRDTDNKLRSKSPLTANVELPLKPVPDLELKSDEFVQLTPTTNEVTSDNAALKEAQEQLMALELENRALYLEARKARGEIDTAIVNTSNQAIQEMRAYEKKLQAANADNMALSREIEELRRMQENGSLSVASGDVSLEKSTERYNEAEREIKRLGLLLEQQRSAHRAEKIELEKMLFDPAVTDKEQRRRLNELELQLAAAERQLHASGRSLQNVSSRNMMPSVPVARVDRQNAVSPMAERVDISRMEISRKSPVSATAAEPSVSARTPRAPVVQGYASANDQRVAKAETERMNTVIKPNNNERRPIRRMPDQEVRITSNVQDDKANVQGLLQRAGVSGNVTSAGSGQYEWTANGLKGRAQIMPETRVSSLDQFAQNYIATSKKSCGGDFASLPSNTTSKGQSFEVACVGGNSNVSSSVVFYKQGSDYIMISHESTADNMDAAMDIRDRIAGSL